MGMMNWIKQLLANPSDMEEITRLSSQLDSNAAEEEAAGLNFRTAIDAHAKWKARLSRYVEGTSTEILHAETICKDNECVLGKWIYGAGQKQYGKNPLFENLRIEHRRFHECACEVIKEVDNGNQEKASNLLHSGQYSQTSMHVVKLLGKLYQELRSKN